eukprot:CAMPEP_0197053220 /NCGR_PEP_ID=MMETSP1384-20130603/27541_1 /TAXON_ID=29189 /ORGANISM="Ammonia sp." /LENGTH=259 /DNA_ID=CAMNT_0042486077 /DNA_START=84 /DNA_END=860 /DNA_ORIENTATION=+
MASSPFWFAMISITSMIHLAHGQLACNGVEYSGATISYFKMAGVCESTVTTVNLVTTESSSMYECRDGVMYLSQYSERDCSGTATESTISTDATLGYNVACDSGDCEYVRIRSYSESFTDATSCAAFTPTDSSSYTESVYVNGECVGATLTSQMADCDGSSANFALYSGVEDCSGTAASSYTLSSLGSGECGTSTTQFGSSYAYYVADCGTASSSSSDAGSTPAPTTSTTSTTSDGSGTASPTSSTSSSAAVGAHELSW